jgi:exopolyphosphatase/guanosine-5'-triphosphate,3'-diphosphate pyrophosphatase
MKLLNIDTLRVAPGALRHGVLFEMVERDDHTSDTRDLSVQRLALKFGVDAVQSERVAHVAIDMLQQICGHDKVDVDIQRLTRKLGWAAQLHEIGFAISHSDYHKHGAYILDNADMVGFSMPELHRLSLLLLGQRGKLKKLEGELEDDSIALMLIALRLSVLLCHARKTPEYQTLHLHTDHRKKRITLTAPLQWAEDFPQSVHLLTQEQGSWQKMAWNFSFVTK